MIADMVRAAGEPQTECEGGSSKLFVGSVHRPGDDPC